MGIIAPRGSAKNPAALADMPLRNKKLSEDFAAVLQSCHDLNRAMAVVQHGFAVVVRRKIRDSAGLTDRFAAAQAARRATRPLYRAAARSNAAANANLRCWRSYHEAITALAAHKGRSRR
jgi:hypothetical protein